MNGKVLILAPSMLPCANSWGGSQRMYYLANFLSANGKKVITVSPDFGEPFRTEDKVIEYKYEFLEGVFKSDINKKSGHSGREHSLTKSEFILKRIKTKAYYIFTVLDRFIFNEPSCFEGYKYAKWLKLNYKKILKIIRERNVDQIIISGPSFSLFKFCSIVKKEGLAVKIIFDYRDPWHMWNYKKNFAYLREKKYLLHADFVVCFSDAFREDFCRVFRFPREKTATVYNGFSEKEWKSISVPKRSRCDKLVISYVGSMDFNDNKFNYRNPNRIMEAVERLDDPQIELHFIGTNEIDNAGSKNIKFIKKVSQEDSYRYMLESDILLNIHDTEDTSGKYIISGKFFDYLRSGQVIWNIGKSDSLVTKLIKQYKLGFSCENEFENILGKLHEVKKLWENNELYDIRKNSGLKVYEFSREEQNKKYLLVLDNLNRGKT